MLESLSQAWYFTSFGTSAMLQPLLNLYFKRSGLSEVQIGVITAMKPWTSAIAGEINPLLVFLARKIQKQIQRFIVDAALQLQP